MMEVEEEKIWKVLLKNVSNEQQGKPVHIKYSEAVDVLFQEVSRRMRHFVEIINWNNR